MGCWGGGGVFWGGRRGVGARLCSNPWTLKDHAGTQSPLGKVRFLALETRGAPAFARSAAFLSCYIGSLCNNYVTTM